MNDFVYATDEDLALRATADFPLLAPRDQKVAAGVEGYFSPSDRWVLRSDSINFEAAGVTAGQVVQVFGPSPQFRPPGEAFVALSVSEGAVTLRRKGQPSGFGQPPAPASGLVGVEYLIVTLAPQIERIGSELERRFGIVCGGVSGAIDPRSVREVIVLGVLHDQYVALSREVGGDRPDAFGAKAAAIKAKLDDLISGLVVRRGDGCVPASRFSTRLTR